MNKLVEAAARALAPRCWEVMDSERDRFMEKYKGQNVAYPSTQFQHSESMASAQAAILAFLQAALEDEGAVEDGAKAMLADDAPKQSFDAAWESEQEIWKQNARSFLRALIARAQSVAPDGLE